jgi:hypothetical protein
MLHLYLGSPSLPMVCFKVGLKKLVIYCHIFVTSDTGTSLTILMGVEIAIWAGKRKGIRVVQ